VKPTLGWPFAAKRRDSHDGTFLGGIIWVGNKSMPPVAPASLPPPGLTETLNQLGFETDRLKTGTPATGRPPFHQL
jgi:tRNA uridine 5-carboxymethylaminomethyl modification enzyme